MLYASIIVGSEVNERRIFGIKRSDLTISERDEDEEKK